MRKVLSNRRIAILAGTTLAMVPAVSAGQPALEAEAPYSEVRELRGLPLNQIVYVLRSPFITNTDVRIIVQTPTAMEPGKRYPVLYMLNEYPGNGGSLKESERLKIFDTHQVICVNVGYPSMPWYADHPTDASLRQESFLIKAAIPLVDSRLPTRAEGAGRFLIGYSKAGFGAFTLLLRHPDLFARAAAWDAPLSLEKPDRWDMATVYGTQENYDRYAPLRLFQEKAALFRDKPARFILLGYGLFPDETRATHERMADLRIPHEYDNSIKREHHWGSGWFEDAVARLMGGRP